MAQQRPTTLYKLPSKPQMPGGVNLTGIGIGLVLLALVLVATTQYLAHAFGYHASLGPSLISIGGFRVYEPWKFAVWVWQWGNQDQLKPVFSIAYAIVVGGAFAAVIGAALISYALKRGNANETEHLHGSAHWATREEIDEMGVLGNSGVYIGAWKDEKDNIRYLRHDGPEHVMVFAPTRSGKGVGLVIPTLLAWPHSALVYDIKGENFALTAGFRKEKAGNHILKFEPTATDGSSVKFNPLEEIRLRTQQEVSDVQNIVTMIVDPDGKGLNDHWSKTGHALLVGALLHVLYSEKDKTLRGVSNFLSDPSRTLEDTMALMMNTVHDPDGGMGWVDNMGQSTKTHPVVASSARDMMNKSENERSGVLSTAMSFLTLYRDPIVASNTCRSEFKVMDLMNLDQPVSLYLVVPPSDKDRLKPLIRLIINQIIRKLTESMKFAGGRSVASYKHRLLLMIDEFPSLGRLDIFQESLAFIAGYGMKAYLITQDLSQLYGAYGKDESIMSNCHVRIAYAPNKIETAELLSKMSGQTTVQKLSESFSGGRTKVMLNQISTSIQEVQRPLLTPDEAMRLPGPTKDAAGNITEAGDMLIFIAGKSPIYGKQILYFKDPVFLARAKLAPPTMSDRVRGADEAKDAPTPQAQVATVPVAAAAFTEVCAEVVTPEVDHSSSQSDVEIADGPEPIKLRSSMLGLGEPVDEEVPEELVMNEWAPDEDSEPVFEEVVIGHEDEPIEAFDMMAELTLAAEGADESEFTSIIELAISEDDSNAMPAPQAEAAEAVEDVTAEGLDDVLGMLYAEAKK